MLGIVEIELSKEDRKSQADYMAREEEAYLQCREGLGGKPTMWEFFYFTGFPPPVDVAEEEIGLGSAIRLVFDQETFEIGPNSQEYENLTRDFPDCEIWDSEDSVFILFGRDDLIKSVESKYHDHVTWTYQRGFISV